MNRLDIGVRDRIHDAVRRGLRPGEISARDDHTRAMPREGPRRLEPDTRVRTRHHHRPPRLVRNIRLRPPLRVAAAHLLAVPEKTAPPGKWEGVAGMAAMKNPFTMKKRLPYRGGPPTPSCRGGFGGRFQRESSLASPRRRAESRARRS